MKPSKIFNVLDMAMKAREQGEIFNPLFVSPPGIGKTEIIEQWCKSNNLPYVILTSALLEAPDVRGFPLIEKINGKQRMVTAVPDFWPDEGKGVIILEEVNRGTTAIMNCWMGLTDKRRGFDNYKLPEGYIVVGAINPENEFNDVNTMDTALKDRFEIFRVAFDKQTFVDYIKKTGWDKSIVNFVESGMWSYVAPEDIKNAPGSKYVSPRTFSKLNAALKAGFNKEDELTIYQTILGDNIGKDFYSFRNEESPVFYRDLLNNKKMALVKLAKMSNPSDFKSGIIGITIQDIIDVNEIDDELLMEVCKVLPVNQSTVLIKELEFKRNDKSILERLCSNDKELKTKFKSVLTYGK